MRETRLQEKSRRTRGRSPSSRGGVGGGAESEVYTKFSGLVLTSSALCSGQLRALPRNRLPTALPTQI